MSQRKEVRIDQLPPQQLSGLKEQLEEELNGLAQSAATLQNVASEFHRSGEAIERLADQKVGERPDGNKKLHDSCVYLHS